jgi:hypothetical protein
MNRMGLPLQQLLRYADEDTTILNRIVTGNKSLVHHYQRESKRASMQWKHPSSPSTKKFKVTPSAGKVVLNVFWDSQRLLLAHFQKPILASRLECAVAKNCHGLALIY